MPSQYCLKWNSHIDVMKEFKHFLSMGIMVDVTLACDGQSLKAHKLVLSACSPFFRNLFLENPCKHPIVILKDVKYIALKTIVDFMYNGEVNVEEDRLSDLIKTAQTLRVSGLGEDLSRCDPSPPDSENLSEDESSNLSTCTLDVNETLEHPQGNQINIQDLEPERKLDVVHDDMNNSASCSKTLTIPLIPCDSEFLESQQLDKQCSSKRAVEEKDYPFESTTQSNMQQHQNHTESSSGAVPETVTHKSADGLVTDHQEPSTSTSSFKKSRKNIEPEEQILPQKSSKKIRFEDEESQALDNLKQSDENSDSTNVGDKDSGSSTSVKFHKCHSCSFRSLYLKSLKRHIVRFHAKTASQAEFQCNECTYTTHYKTHLVQHLEAVHQWKLQCSLCTYTTANEHHLKRHMECVHGEKSFQCNNCSFTSTRKDMVKRHEKKHRKKK